jgi:hypothetical protein
MAGYVAAGAHFRTVEQSEKSFPVVEHSCPVYSCTKRCFTDKSILPQKPSAPFPKKG